MASSSETKAEVTGGALDGFITLVQTNKGPACAMVIQQVLRSSAIYQFGEILTEPNVQELDKIAEHKPWLDLLKVFAYGTYAEYKSSKTALRLPALTAVQLTKLRQLTIATHASQHKTLAYDMLLRELDLSVVRELEDLLIDCVYLGLIKGKLDQRKSAFEVSFAIGRDIGPSDVDFMIRKLNLWLDASAKLTTTLETQVRNATELKLKEKEDEEELSKEKKERIEHIKLQQKESESAGGGAVAGVMGGLAGLIGLDAGGPDRARRRGPQRGPGGGGRMGMMGFGGRDGPRGYR